MDTSPRSEDGGEASWFGNEPESPQPSITKISIVKLAIVSCIILLIVVALLSAYPFVMESRLSWMHFICVPVFGATQFALMMGLIFSIALAVKMYRATDQFWTQPDNALDRDMSIFNTLAMRHKHLSQLWFNIAVAILLGGLIYAAMHVMEPSCGVQYWGVVDKSGTVPEGSVNHWPNVVVHALPNIFLYSIFFVAWAWALKNYRAHWHNFVTNEHRYASLRAIDRIRCSAGDEVKAQLEMQGAVVVLLPSESAYLEGEGEREITAGERLLKIEEAIRNLTTRAIAPSKTT